ncbi:MAG: glycosyl transferase family 90 [Pseudomonadota bacterium]
MLRIISIIILFFNVAFASELITIDAEKYIKQNPSLERKELVNFLNNQFNGKTVNQKQLDNLWENTKLRETYMMSRFQIVNQKVYADSYYIAHYYFPTLLQYFQDLSKKYKIPDVDFIIYLREEIPMSEELGKETMNIPAFMMFQDKTSIYETDKLLFPDAFFIKENWESKWRNILNRIKKANTQHPWEQKIEKIFWRGMTTGDFHDYTIANFNKLPRLTASVLSKLYPNLIDSEFTYYSPQVTGEDLMKFFKSLFGKDKIKVSEENHLKYKYLLSLDGNAATGTRIPWIMYSNSVLVKQESQKIQWYYTALKPYVNYVPLKHDLTDIFEQINWMKSHDDEVHKIALNAHEFVANNLMPDDIDKQIVILLKNFAKIQENKQISATLVPAEDIISVSSVINMYLFRIKRYIMDRIKTWK